MFGKTFLAELFKAQAVYTNSSTRQIFDRLAHSSIMRLNTSSMDKVGGSETCEDLSAALLCYLFLVHERGVPFFLPTFNSLPSFLS